MKNKIIEAISFSVFVVGALVLSVMLFNESLANKEDVFEIEEVKEEVEIKKELEEPEEILSYPDEIAQERHKLERKYKVDHGEKPTQSSINQLYFKSNIFPRIKKEECNLKKAFCHIDKKDTGGLTCCGVSIVSNPNWFKDNLNSFLRNCLKYPSPKNLYFCKIEDLLITVQDLYLSDKYSKYIRNCETKIYTMLLDQSVLNGLHTIIRHFQASQGLVVDGVFGPNTLRKCSKDGGFNAAVFIKYRKKYLSTRKTAKTHKKGWFNRLDRLLLSYNDKTKE